MESYDLAVIGSGPSGFAAAMRAFDFKKKVCIIESNHIGGAGIMNGALSSKTMWELSKDFALAGAVNRGYRSAALHVDFKEIIKITLQAAKDKQYQILSQIETFSKEKAKEGNITLKQGLASFINYNTIEVKTGIHKEKIHADNFIIATGSRPVDYPGIEIDQERILDSDGILNLKKFPERMLIIGSGIIGCEFATIFSNFKQTEVHLLDHAHKVLPYEDDDISDFVSKNLENNGVIFHHTANLRTIKKYKKHLEVILDYFDGHSKVIEVDVALIAIGRKPNFESLCLDRIGIHPTEKGFLNINEFCMLTDNPLKGHIYAVGDITGKGFLYSIAEHQGRHAVESIYMQTPYQSDYSTMPTLMFFKPILASVGASEKQLRKNNIPYRVAVYSNALVNRTIAMRNTNGFVKIIVSDNEENKILGMKAASPQASAFIISVAHLINQGNKLNEVLKVVHPHPSETEGIQECLRVLQDESVYKPTAFPDLIKVNRWKPE